MNRTQKIAWYSLSVIAVVLLLTAVITYWVVTKGGWHKSASGLCAIGLSCIAGIGPLIFRRDKTQTVQRDERDALIELRALYVGYSGCYCYFAIAGMTLVSLHGFNGAVPVKWLIPFLVGGYVAAELVRSITILSQYGPSGKESSKR